MYFIIISALENDITLADPPPMIPKKIVWIHFCNVTIILVIFLYILLTLPIFKTRLFQQVVLVDLRGYFCLHQLVDFCHQLDHVALVHGCDHF